jgi:hypothetical protein
MRRLVSRSGEAIGQFRQEDLREPGMAIAGDDHGPAVALQRLQRVQKLLLRRRLPGEEVQIVDEQGIAIAELPAKRRLLPRMDRAEEAVREVLRRQVQDAGVGPLFAQLGVDPLEQMRLAESHRSVQHEWRRAASRIVDDADQGRMRDPVARPDDEVREPAPTCLPLRRLGRPRRMGRIGAHDLRPGRGWTGIVLRSLVVMLALMAKQLRIDPEADLDRSAEHPLGRSLEIGCELLLQPVLEEPVRDADRECVGLPVESRVRGEP